MARKPAAAQTGEKVQKEKPGETVSLTRLMMKKPQFTNFNVWLIGETPLICHAWSEKSKREMLAKHVKAPSEGKEIRKPEEEYVATLYEMGDGTYGFPAMAIKKAMIAVANVKKGIAKTDVKASFWLTADMVRTRPALAGAICDMPLLRLYGSKPEMREDMVKIGKGLQKTAGLSYRAQFTHWGLRVTGRYNPAILNGEQLSFLVFHAGVACGIGEWRNERDGMFGAFRLADVDEEGLWDAYAAGTGPLPVPETYKMAAE